MEIAVFGAGYVGLVTGAGLSTSGNHITVLDTVDSRIQGLRKGQLPFFEPQLQELIKQGMAKGHLHFATIGTPDALSALKSVEAFFVAVGTPESPGGKTDLQYVESVVKILCEVEGDLRGRLVVTKSTVPVGTGDWIEGLLAKKSKYPTVVSNPEFLKQGNAVQDFLKPERVIVGTDSHDAIESLRFLYKPYMMKRDRFIAMSRRSAELVKYACNTFLATKISFINEIAQLAERVGADIREIREGMITDSRIGDQFLFPGIGYGGSCFPKDVYSLIHQASESGLELKLSRAARDVNVIQKQWPFEKLKTVFKGSFKGKTICLWGLSFKPNTDDLREAPSLSLIKSLVDAGALVRATDPVATELAAKQFSSEVSEGSVQFFGDAYEAAKGSDALVIVTEWQEYRTPHFAQLKACLKKPLIIDGRNIYESTIVSQKYGFEYHSVGRI